MPDEETFHCRTCDDWFHVSKQSQDDPRKCRRCRTLELARSRPAVRFRATP